MPSPRPGGLAAVTLVLLLLAAGCALSGHPPGTAGQARHQESSAAAAEYLAAAEPANRRLDAEVQSYADHEHRNLAAAEAALRAEAVTERWFDQCPHPNHTKAKNPSTTTVTPRLRPLGNKFSTGLMSSVALRGMRGWQHPMRLRNDRGGEEVAMRLGMVHTPVGEPSVAVRRGDDWVPLLTVPAVGRVRLPPKTDARAAQGDGDDERPRGLER